MVQIVVDTRVTMLDTGLNETNNALEGKTMNGNPIKNAKTEAECVRIAKIAKTDRETAGQEFVKLVNTPTGPLKFWEVRAIKERIQFLLGPDCF